MKPAKACRVVVWAIRCKSGSIVLPSLRTTRALCIGDYVRLPGNKSVDRVIAKRWRKMKKWGWGCERVTLFIGAEKC